MSIDEQPMNVYWSGKRTETSNNFKTNYKGSVATKNNLPSSGNKTGDMYNVTESGENFIWNGNSWDNLSGDALKTLNWQKTETAQSVTFYAVPDTVVEPVVEFAYTETAPAEGTKAPDNPSSFTGVDGITLTHCEESGLRETEYAFDFGTTVYGGSLDVATGTLTVTFGIKSVLQSDIAVATWFSAPDGAVAYVSYVRGGRYSTAGERSLWSCDHVPSSNVGERMSVASTSSAVYLCVNESRLDYSDAADSENPTNAEKNAAFKKLLREEDWNVVFPLEEQYTIQLEPEIIKSLVPDSKYEAQKNTVFTSAISVQVGYAKSPIRSEFELTQAIIATEGGE